jgi:hypothetical protein
MAINLQNSSQADHVLVQLYTDDTETLHNKNKPIMVYNFLLNKGVFYQANHLINGPIKRKQNQAALFTFDLLRRYLQQKSMNFQNPKDC